MSNITTTDSNFEKILASFLTEGSVTLTPKQEEMKNRIKTAFSLLLNFHSREQAAKVMEQQFEISTATAYRDIGNALKIYGDINKASKEGMRYIIFEYNQKLLQLATKEKNLEAMGRALDRMIKLAELDKEENLVNLEKLANMDITISIGKKAEKAIVEANNKGVVNLNDFQAEDIDYEDLGDLGSPARDWANVEAHKKSLEDED